MKRLGRILVFVFVALLLLLIAGISMTVGWRPFLGPRVRPLTARAFEASPARMERGRYLVRSVTGCLECHSERDKNSPEAAPMAGREGGGALFASDPGLGTVYAPNITPDKETGIGNWTDDQ